MSVCLSVYDYSRTTGYEAAYERYQQLQCYKSTKNNVAILLKRLRPRDMARLKSQLYNEHWLTSTRFSPFSASWSKRGYVSKSSAALNPLTITQLACERYIAIAWARSRIALRGPAHQLAVRRRIIITTHPPATAPGVCLSLLLHG